RNIAVTGLAAVILVGGGTTGIRSELFLGLPLGCLLLWLWWRGSRSFPLLLLRLSLLLSLLEFRLGDTFACHFVQVQIRSILRDALGRVRHVGVGGEGERAGGAQGEGR